METAPQPPRLDHARQGGQPWLGGILVVDNGLVFDVDADGETRWVKLARR